MALITQTSLTSGSSGTNGTSIATASVSPTANRLVIVAAFGGAATPGNATDPSGVSGAGLTFTKLKAQNNTTTFGLNTSIWYAMSASPSSGAITITYPNTQDLFIWSVFELAGVNVAGGTGSNAVNSNTASAQDITGLLTTLGTTLSSFGSSNNGAICATINARATTAATATPDTGWTEIHDLSLVSGGIGFALETQWRDSNDTSPSETWSAAGAIQIVAAEIVAATSTGTLATANANDTASAAGTTTVLGTLSRTNANDTSSAGGTTTVQGTLARTNANDSVSASGSVGSAVSGTLDRTNANDASNAAGTTSVVGAASRTNANDTSAASGSTTVVGASASTNANDSISASGAAGAVTGTVSTTNANDSLVAAGNTPISASTVVGAPGGASRYIAYINGKRYAGSYWQIKAMVEELAEDQAEKEIAKAKQVKRVRIVVEQGKEASRQIESIVADQPIKVQQEIRSIYNEAYARAKLKLEEELDEEEAILMLL